jgi:hypothetical protein
VYQSGLATPADRDLAVAAAELVLEALVAEQRISRSEEYGWQRAKPRRKSYGSDSEPS